MLYIEKIKIKGFKKFKSIDIDFKRNINVIVGENESGKSTIVEAINIVMNQMYKNVDKYIVKDLINIDLITEFSNSPTINNLPKVLIEIQFKMDNDVDNSFEFFGTNYYETNGINSKYGIQFKCEFDESFSDSLNSNIESGKIPFEYYLMTWTTFRGDSYNALKKPLKLLTIDNSIVAMDNTFNYYNKAVFNNKFTDKEKMNIKNKFRDNLATMFDELGLPKLETDQKFGVNSKKVILENIITIFDGEIPIENKGKGTENLIKTKIALDKRKNNLDTIVIEEPENHLSHTSLRKMLDEIINNGNETQLIVTTHNNLIVNRLNIDNVLWINDNSSHSLSSVNESVGKFFEKADNNNLLQFLLAKKVILVEGATEYILMSKIFTELFGETLEEREIDVISCNGISYKNYLEIAERTNKKVVVITDNDKKVSRTEKMNLYNEENENRKIYMDNNVNNWTWEACLFYLNETTLTGFITVQEGVDYLFNGNDYGVYLGKMLNNKVEMAYNILNSDLNLIYPDYIKDALTWIRE